MSPSVPVTVRWPAVVPRSITATGVSVFRPAAMSLVAIVGSVDFAMLAKAQGIEGTHVREPQGIEAALRRGVDAIRAGEPYVLDVRVATVGSGADSTWHQRFKLGKS
jgi:hypothetical protein